MERIRELHRCGAVLTKARAALPLAAVLALGACGTAAPTQKTAPDVVDEVPDDWSPDAVTDLEALVGRLNASGPGMCTAFTVTSTADYKLGLVTQQHAEYIPRALGLCSVVVSGTGDSATEENVEIVLHDDEDRRDEFITERADVICTLSERDKIGLPGLRFAIGPTWSIQTDTQSVALDIAGILGGSYRAMPCGEQGDPDWDADALARVQDVAADVAAAGIGCDVTIADRDIVRRQPHYVEIGLPGALASCDADYGTAGASTLGFVAYDSDSTPREEFLPEEFDELCGGGADVRIVAGDGWDLFAVTGPHAELAANATGGSLTDDRCEVVVVATTTTVPVQGPVIPEED